MEWYLAHGVCCRSEGSSKVLHQRRRRVTIGWTKSTLSRLRLFYCITRQPQSRTKSLRCVRVKLICINSIFFGGIWTWKWYFKSLAAGGWRRELCFKRRFRETFVPAEKLKKVFVKRTYSGLRRSVTSRLVLSFERKERVEKLSKTFGSSFFSKWQYHVNVIY